MASNGVSGIGAPRFPETDAPQTGADYEEVADYAAFRGNFMLGTAAEMWAFAAAGYARVGNRWYNTTDGYDYQYTTTWELQHTLKLTIGSFGADGNATVLASGLTRDINGFVDLLTTTQRTGATTYATHLIIGVLPVGFRPPNDWFGRAFTYGSGTPNDVKITAASGIVELVTASPAGHTVARTVARFRV